MSRIRDYNINMDSSVTIGDKEEEIEIPETVDTIQIKDVMEPIIQRAKEKAQEIIAEARAQAKKEIDELKARKEVIEQEIEKLKLSAYEQSEKQGYDTGYDRGFEEGTKKAEEEMAETKAKIEEQLLAVDDFAKSSFEIKNKILSSTRGDILDLCFEISKKICLKSLDSEMLGRIIDKALLLLDTKSQVNVMISPVLFERLPEDFDKKFMNIRIVKNSKISEDSIIVESLSGNIDCTISTQIDKITNEILNGKSD